MDEEAAGGKLSQQAAARRTAEEKGKGKVRVPITRQKAALEAEAAADLTQAKQASLEPERNRHAHLLRSTAGEGSSKDAMNNTLALMPPIPAA